MGAIPDETPHRSCSRRVPSRCAVRRRAFRLYDYNYQRFGIGIYLESLFYGSRYRISDPWRYRLPDAQWPYEWVRYYDDVLLVDTRNGYVVDVIYSFFW